MTTPEKQKPRGLAGTGAAFKNNDKRDNNAVGGFVKLSRTDRRQKRGWTRGRR